MILIKAIICSAAIVFIHAIFWDGNILGRIRSMFLDYLPIYIRKPIYYCLKCMTVLYCILFTCLGFIGLNITEFIMTTLVTGGILTLIEPLISDLEDLSGEKFVDNKDK